jgi:hypothetical protein
MRIEDELTDAFGRQVDLGCVPPPDSQLAKHIEAEGVVLFEAKSDPDGDDGSTVFARPKPQETKQHALKTGDVLSAREWSNMVGKKRTTKKRASGKGAKKGKKSKK